MNIFDVIKMLLGVLPFVLFCLVSSKINLSKPNRGRQFLMPVVTAVYCIAAVIFLEKLSALVLGLLDWLAGYLPIIESLNPELLVIYAVNILLVLGNMILKMIVLPILNGIWSSNSVMNCTSSLFYDYEDDVDKWFIKKEFANFRGFCRGIYYALLVASSVVFALSLNFPEAKAFEAVLYPFFGILILNEIVNFLSGMTKSEFVEDILGEDEESYKVANYGMLRKILRDLYGDRVLYENTLDTTNSISDTFDALTEMSESDERIDHVMGEYFLALKENGEDIDINYVKSSVNLLKGNSTLFNNPFYKDLTNYIMVPVTKQLIHYQKCLIVVGRDSIAKDALKWIDDGIAAFTGTGSLWKSKILDENYSETDIGIVKFSDIYNLKMHQANKEFLKDVGFFILIEPSRILASGQIGLNLLVNECEAEDKKIVYCACDRNCDGLVDALSHTLKTSITEVTATLAGSANSSQMYWNADGSYMHHKIFPNISRYLGMGTEINSVALKYQLKNTGWIGSEKFPVIDMKWIAGQYYKEICDYADLPASQDAFNRAFHVESNLWSCEKKDHSFLVVEDEFQNLFEATRTFASRAKKQGFINVISENYFLRDYMLDNVEVFLADPKAIPTIVPDYARTERNTVLKLIMMMVHNPVSEERIEKELMLCGIGFEDAYETLKGLIIKHCNVADATLSVLFKEKLLDDSLNTKTVKYYEVNETNELYTYAQMLKNAYYIAEDEEGEKHYIGAKLYGHVFQALLPGQFMTFDGKYYEIQTITPLNGVVARRAADHITGRKYYRQIRSIKLDSFVEGTEMASKKSISGVEIINGFANITVDTAGYLEMDSYGNFKDAKKVFINNIPSRRYRNKSVLKIKLPGMDEKVRYTLCLLLNEVFRTTYPNAYPYISAVAPNTESDSEELKYVTYDFVGECESDCFYIIEDSDVDLGLTVSVERNLKRYLEIVLDVLMWHSDKMLETPTEQEPVEEYVPVFTENEPAEKKKGILERVKGFFKKKFGKKKKPEQEPVQEEVPEEEALPEVPEPEEAEEEPAAEVPGEEAVAEETQEEPEKTEPETLHNFVTARFSETANEDPAEDIAGEDEELMTGAAEQTPYQKHCFLKFGYETVSERLDIPGTIEYLTGFGLDKNPLHQVRCGDDLAEAEGYDPHKYGAHLCDFCGVELLGGEYEVLKDGRERCNRCSMTAIKTVDGFKDVYKGVMRNMEIYYNIKLNTAIKVRMTDAKKIAKHVGMTFVATPGFDGRVLGFAQKDKTGYSIYIENGSPKLGAIGTIAHELTHIWQYLNWNEADIDKTYGKANSLEIYEGMAKWVEIQYLILLGEKAYAKRQEITTRLRNDAYGRGFIKFCEKYPLCYDTNLRNTPFQLNPPL